MKMSWLPYALIVVLCWGLYGNALHSGQMAMADKEFGRWKAFLWVGIAYFVVAIVGPLLVMKLSGNTNWSMPTRGRWLSFGAGALGAVGAFFVLYAMGAGVKAGTPPMIVAILVMSTIFAGAPIINAVTSVIQHPPEGGIGRVPLMFWFWILFTAFGAFMVVKNKPVDPPKAKPAVAKQS